MFVKRFLITDRRELFYYIRKYMLILPELRRIFINFISFLKRTTRYEVTKSKSSNENQMK